MEFTPSVLQRKHLSVSHKMSDLQKAEEMTEILLGRVLVFKQMGLQSAFTVSVHFINGAAVRMGPIS